MDNKAQYSQEERKANHFLTKSTKELENELNVLIHMTNNGGMLADDIIEELGKRLDRDDLQFPFSRTIETFLLDCKNFKVDNQTYYISYVEFLKYFRDLTTITRHNLIVSINFTYGWMPTIFDFRSDKFDEAIEILNKAKNGSIPKENELKILKGLFNNSLVGTSKLLHFINPDKFAIWDSRVYHYLTGKKAYDHRIGNCELYIKYLAFCNYIVTREEYGEVHNSICDKLGYQMTKLRTAELIMYSNG